MKNITFKALLLFLSFTSSFFNANAQYDVYFTNQQLRIDYYIYGNSDTCYYALDKYVKEPVWGGTKTHLVDSLEYGDYLKYFYMIPTSSFTREVIVIYLENGNRH